MLETIGIIMVVLSFIFTLCWQNSGNSLTFSRSAPGTQEKFELKFKKLSLKVTAMAFVILTINRVYRDIDIWSLVSIACFISCVVILSKAFISRESIFEVKLHDNQVINYIFIDLSLIYLYLFVWIKSFVLLTDFVYR